MTISQGSRKWIITRIENYYHEVISSGFELAFNNGTSEHLGYTQEDIIRKFNLCVESEIEAI
jgi:mannitol-specific phosphotransferase system IIBC component